MAVDTESVDLSIVNMHEYKCTMSLLYRGISVILLECTQPADNLFHSCLVPWEKEYFLTSNLLCPFTSVKTCPLILVRVLISKKKLQRSIIIMFMTIRYSMQYNKKPSKTNTLYNGNIMHTYIKLCYLEPSVLCCAAIRWWTCTTDSYVKLNMNAAENVRRLSWKCVIQLFM